MIRINDKNFQIELSQMRRVLKNKTNSREMKLELDQTKQIHHRLYASEFPIEHVSPMLLKTLSDPLLGIRKNEIKVIIQLLFNKMLPITSL